MRSWYWFFEMLQFPAKVLFVAFILLGVGELLSLPAIVALMPLNNTMMTVSAGLRFLGTFIVNNFPLLVVIKMVSRRQDTSTPIYAAVIGYIVFIIASAFLAPSTYDPEFYSAIFGVNVTLGEFIPLSDIVLYPFQTGVFAAIAVIWCTRIAYRTTRGHSGDGWFGYVDRDTLTVILTMILCFLACILVTALWPMMINFITGIIEVVARDITNPINLFIYGIADRLLSLCGLGSILHKAFWFGSYGGSWISSSGTNYFGDVGVWTAQQAGMIVSNGAGRLITPYYIINFFAVPAIAIVTWLSLSDPNERKRYFTFMVFASIVSILFGTMLPFEFFLLITSPLILLIHILTTGMLFGILQSLNVFIGYSYNGSQAYANPGSLFDLITYFNDTYTRSTLYLFLIVGAVIFVFYFLVSYLYYNYLALDLVTFGNKRIVDLLVESIGGLGNILNIQASTTKVTVKAINPSIVDFSILHENGVGKIVENKDGYNIFFGSDSIIIRREIIKRIRGK